VLGKKWATNITRFVLYRPFGMNGCLCFLCECKGDAFFGACHRTTQNSKASMCHMC